MAELESQQNSIREAPKHYGAEQESTDAPGPELAVDAEFIERMRACADLVGSVNALARKSGLSQSGIRRYFTGGDPTRRVLIAIAEAAGVNVLWLVSGEGTMLRESPAGAAALGEALALAPEILQLSLETIEEALLKSGRKMSPAKKAELAMAVYELYRRGDGRIDKSAVLRLVKLAT